MEAGPEDLLDDRAASEELGLGGQEFVPWHLGAVV
jgi:hypothetical protein